MLGIGTSMGGITVAQLFANVCGELSNSVSVSQSMRVEIRLSVFIEPELRKVKPNRPPKTIVWVGE